MRRSNLTEQKLVVVLFILVLITFFFAQADTSKIEKMYLNNTPAVTTSLDQNENAEGQTQENKQVIPVVQLR